jgi:hypothetical protein
LLDLLSRSEQIDILDKEELGFDHADDGVNLLKIWNLFDFHIEIVTFHYKPRHASHFAHILANIMQLGNSGEQPVSLIRRGSLGKPENL